MQFLRQSSQRNEFLASYLFSMGRELFLAFRICPWDSPLMSQTNTTTNASAATTALHTPGPWATDIAIAAEIIAKEGYFGEDGNRRNDTRIAGGVVYVDHGGGKGGEICFLRHDPQDGMNLSDAEYQANARLMAAAPELLEALKTMVSESGRCGWDVDRAKAAIAKAIGE